MAGMATASATDSGAGAVIQLAHSLAPLRDHFNAGADRRRFVALLSPT